MKLYANLGARMLAHIRYEGECWIWTGALSPAGYGRFTVRIGGKPYCFWAHRAAYELFLAKPIPEGMTLDHTCRRKACVRPGHLEPVSREENSRRMHKARAKAYDELIAKLQFQLDFAAKAVDAPIDCP
jgi:hypothetical protein